MSMTYDDAIGGQTRRTTAQTTFEFLDVTASSDATLSVNDKLTSVSRENDIIDLRDFSTAKYTTLEHNYFKMDGSCRLTPRPNETIPYHVGWWSDSISDENGEFQNPPCLTFDFTTNHSSVGLTMDFDKERPKEIQIIYYDSSDNELSNETIQVNDTHIVYGGRVTNYRKIKIFINKTLNPYRRVRVYSVIFGIIQQYKNNEILELNIIRENSLVDNTIPFSNMEIKLNNISREFNFINPSGIFAFLQSKQLLKTKMGVYLSDDEIEWVDTGSYYLNAWQTDGITATLTATDKLFFVKNVFSVATNTTKTLKQWAVDILASANYTDYIIDDSLASISVTTRFDNMDAITLLKCIAIAGQCIMYLDKNDKVVIKPISTTKTNEITFDNMYKEPLISLEEVTSDVDVAVWSYNVSTEDQTHIVINNPDAEETNVFEVKDNPFITTTTIATNVGNWIMNILKNRLIYNIDWRQNMKIELSDKVQVEDGFNENKNMIVTKQEFKYSGYLSGSTEGRGTN